MPVWIISDDTAVSVTPAFSTSIALPAVIQTVVTPAMTAGLARRSVSSGATLFSTVWPTNLGTYGLSADMQQQALDDCTSWFSGPMEADCAGLYPTPAEFYWVSCLRQVALSGNNTQGLQAALTFALYCQTTLGLTVWPAQSLCNDGLAAARIDPDCTTPCVYGLAATTSNNSVYCQCDALHFGSDCSQLWLGVSANVLCSEHGVCDSVHSGCMCDDRWRGDALCSTCTPGWVGTDCSVAISTLPATLGGALNVPAPGVCVSFSDPHMTTYSGTNYNMDSAGTYILSRTPGTLIQALQVPCAANGPCIRNDEVSVQSGSITVSFYAPADGTNNMLVAYDIGDGLLKLLAYPATLSVGGLSVTWYLNLRHKAVITTPEGVSMNAAVYYSLLSVAITVPYSLNGQTSGLCGAFNHNIISDFSWRPCLPGRTGQFCDVLDCPGGGPGRSGRGTCELATAILNALPVCMCDPGFGGPDCSQLTCNGTPVCSGPMHGTCELLTPNASAPQCVCTNYTTRANCQNCIDGYGGKACTVPLSCPGAPKCGGSGACVVQNEVATCSCPYPHDGPNCDICVHGLAGPNCTANLTCPSNCSGIQGWCQPSTLDSTVGECLCRDAFEGPNCATALCASAANCSNRGTCVPMGISTMCMCHGNSTGSDCSACLPGFSGADCNYFYVNVSAIVNVTGMNSTNNASFTNSADPNATPNISSSTSQSGRHWFVWQLLLLVCIGVPILFVILWLLITRYYRRSKRDGRVRTSERQKVDAKAEAVAAKTEAARLTAIAEQEAAEAKAEAARLAADKAKIARLAAVAREAEATRRVEAALQVEVARQAARVAAEAKAAETTRATAAAAAAAAAADDASVHATTGHCDKHFIKYSLESIATFFAALRIWDVKRDGNCGWEAILLAIVMREHWKNMTIAQALHWLHNKVADYVVALRTARRPCH